MTYYIATSLDNWRAHNALRDALDQNQGWECTYDWTVHGSVQQDGVDRIREVAVLESNGVHDADFVVGILPGGRGTHVELGIAIGASIPVILLVTPEHTAAHPHTCAFYHHPGVRIIHLGAGVTPAEAVPAIYAALEDWPWGIVSRARFVDRVLTMRKLQREYFKSRDGGVLQRAKAAEKRVDEALEPGTVQVRAPATVRGSS